MQEQYHENLFLKVCTKSKYKNLETHFMCFFRSRTVFEQGRQKYFGVFTRCRNKTNDFVLRLKSEQMTNTINVLGMKQRRNNRLLIGEAANLRNS